MPDSTKRLGILGLGSRSTLHYIELLNDAYNKKMGGYSTCPFVLLNTNFDDFNPYLPYQFTILEARLGDALDDLEQLGANLFLIPNITLHQTFDRLKRDVAIAHPIELTAKKLLGEDHVEAYLLGTSFTMNSSHFTDSFGKHGIKVLAPTEAEMTLVDDFRKKVYDGAETTDDVEAFMKCLADLREEHPVILACTELSVLELSGEEGVYDMAALQVEHCVREIF